MSERRKVLKKYIVLFVLTILLSIPVSVSGSESNITNNNGVVISATDYAKIRKLYSEAYVQTMTPAEYYRIMTLGINFDGISPIIKYIKTEYNNVDNTTTHTEVTKEEFDSFEPEEPTKATVIETSYKRLQLILIDANYGSAFFTFSALWKVMPQVRSFDVIGARMSNLTVVNGTQQGKQMYKLNGEHDFVQYSFNGTNIKNLSNGFGISMNLLNSNVTELECNIDASMYTSGTTSVLFASYQHATSDISLATSQSYILQAAGLGDVFSFSNNNHQYFDGMQGTWDYFNHP